MAKVKGKVGDVLKINLGNNSFGYGRVLENPLMEFFDFQSKSSNSIEEIVDSNILFTVWVMNYALKSDNWEVLGNKQPDPSKKRPKFFKQDMISKKFYIYENEKDIPASRSDCVGLERAAVWEPEHIENRLRNHFSGVPDPMTERLKLPEA